MNTKLCAIVKMIGYCSLQVAKLILGLMFLALVVCIAIVLIPVLFLLSPLLFIVPVFFLKIKDSFLRMFFRVMIPLLIFDDIIGIFLNHGVHTKNAVHTYVHYAVDVGAFAVVSVAAGVVITIVILTAPEVKSALQDKYNSYLDKCGK